MASRKEVEKLGLQIAGALTSKDYTQHFEDLRRTLQEHHHTLLDSVPHTVSHGWFPPLFWPRWEDMGALFI
jgi:hypothetical protein